MKNCKIITNKNCNIIINDESFDETKYIQVFVLQLNSTGDSKVLVRETESLEIIFNTTLDGFYTICKLTIPYDIANPYYYKNGKYYHRATEVSLQEILNVNPEVSLIETEYYYYFSTCNLRKCFIKVCQDIFSLQTSVCGKSNIDNSLTYKRDLIWSALNVIEYMAEIDLMEEAQRLLEEITGCNGLCSSQNNSNNCGCGCQ